MELADSLGFRLPRRSHSLLAAAGMLALVSGLSGCGGGLYNVKGTVTVDGQPAGGVGLLFFSQETNELTATARSEPDGTFSAFTDVKPGIPAGKYRVAANWPDPNFKAPPAKFGASPPDPPDLLNGRYMLGKSDLTVEITSASSAPNIELSTK